MIDPRQPDFRFTPVAATRPAFGYLPDDAGKGPLVSVVTPFFNTGDVVRETAASLLRQSLQQWEWIIVNDCSTDPGSRALLAALRSGDQRIRVVDLPRNVGLSAARNAGARAARTPFIVLLDSDDLLEPTAIEKWYWHLRSFPEHGFVKGFSIGFGAQEYLWNHGFHDRERFLEENLVDATSMVRREIFEGVGGFDESTRGGLEDWDFWLKCAAHGWWGATVPEYLNWYRRRTDHTDRWANLGPAARDDFRSRLRSRYAHLWDQGFPAPKRSDALPLPDDGETVNVLRTQGRRLLMILPWMAMGGADKFNLDLVRELGKRGWEISIVATKEGDYSWMPEFARLTPDVFPLTHFLHPRDFPRFLAYCIRSRRPEAVLISNADLGYRLLPFLRSRFPHIAFIDYCHMEEEEWSHGGYPRMGVQFQEQLDLHIVSSNHLKNWMVERGGDDQRIEVCTTNIDTQRWAPDPARRLQERALRSIPDQLPVLLYAGRIVAQKQPVVFLETVRLLRDAGAAFRAIVAGDGPDLPAIQERARQEQLLSHVEFLGEVSNDSIHDLLMMADLLFLPSQWEGISLAVYEAMAAGVAVVGARVGGQAELVIPGTGILVPRSTPEEEAKAYARHLLRLLTHPQELQAMKEAGRKRVEEHFPIQRMGDRMHELLGRAIRLCQDEPRPAVGLGLGWSAAVQAIEQVQNGPDRWWYKGVTDTLRVLLQTVQQHVSRGEQAEAVALLRSTRAIFVELKEHDHARQIDAQIAQCEALLESPRAESAAPQESSLISIVIPCYRQAQYLRDALESVVAQTYGQWEIIVVNDGSPDDTSSVVRAYAARHPERSIRLIEQENRGLPAARNAGCAEAGGTFLVPLDADDRIAPTFLERCLAEIRRDPTVGFVYTHIRRFGDVNDVYELPEFSAHSIVHEDNTASVCALMRKAMWENVGGYNEEMREGYEDWDFWVGCIEKGWKGYRVPEPLFEYRVKGSGMLHEANSRRARLIARIVLNHPGLYGERTRQWAAREVESSGSDGTNDAATRTPSLRVTYLIHNIAGITGGNQTLLHQANALAARGHEVTLVTYGEPPSWIPLAARVIRVPTEMPLARGVPPSDVVIATYFLNALELTEIAAPVKVYFAQGDQFVFADVSEARGDGRDHLRRLRELSLASYLLPGIRLVVNSQTLRRQVHSLVARDVDGVVPVCVDHRIFHPLPKGTPGAPSRILVVGPDSTGTPLEPLRFKGIGDIHAALQLLLKRSVRFTAVRIANTPPEIFAGFPCDYHRAPDDETKTRLFGTADILVYASHYDSCPRPPLEAMAAGAAVVCTATDGAMEYCRDGVNALLVPVGDPTRLAEAVERLLADEPLRQRLIQGGVETARQLPIEREHKEWETLLHRFVREAGGRPLEGPPQSAPEPIPDVSIIVLPAQDAARDFSEWLHRTTNSCGVSHEVLIASPAADNRPDFAAAVNPLAITARGRAVCVMRAGAGLTEGWLKRLLEPLETLEVGIVAPLHVSAVEQLAPGMSVAGYEHRNRHRRLPLQGLPDGCLLFRRELLGLTGIFVEGDERAEPERFRRRAALAGFDAVCAGDVVVDGVPCPDTFERISSLPASADPIERAKVEVLLAVEEASRMQAAGDTNRAVARLEKTLAILPESPKLAVARATVLLQAGAYERVSSLLGSTPESVKRHPVWLEITGFAMQGLGERALAHQCADKALAITPRCPGALLLQGMLAVDEGEPEGAERAFLDAIAADPSAGEPYAHLGALHWARGNREEGRRLIEQAFILSPTLPTVLGSYRQVVQEQDAIRDALPLVGDARRHYPDHRDLALFHVELLAAAGSDREALDGSLDALARFGLDDVLLDAAFLLRSRTGPLQPARADALSLCMIVRDEEATLPRCLMSVLPLVDEIVVIDTGSSDRTPLVAAVYGARVLTMEWHDDFAAARNLALATATGTWVLTLDADERLAAHNLSAFRELLETVRTTPSGVVFTTRNYVSSTDVQGWQPNTGRDPEEAGTGWIASDKVRLFPRLPGIQYDYPVHEIVEESLKRSGIPIVRSDIPVHHYGRLDAARTRVKAERYAAIGRKKLSASGPGDLRSVLELAAQEQELGRHEEAVDLWRAALAVEPAHARAMLGLGVSLTALHRRGEAREALAAAVALDPGLREAYVKYALVSLEMGDIESAATMLRDAADRFPDYPYVHAAVAAVLSCAGHTAEAAASYAMLREQRINPKVFYEDLARDLRHAGQDPFASRIEHQFHLSEREPV